MDNIMDEYNIGDIVYCKTDKPVSSENKIPMEITDKITDGKYASEKNPSYLCSWRDKNTNEKIDNWFKWNEIQK